MLDEKRLEANPLLQAAGWNPVRRGYLQTKLIQLDPRYPSQVPPEAIFPAAQEIINCLDGLVIKNQCPELEAGPDCCAVEFDFFHYDDSVYPELQAIGAAVGRSVLFLGPGYDIAGDWLTDDRGTIYFRNKLTGLLFLFSPDIYSFLEKDIYSYFAQNDQSVFAKIL